MSSADLFSIVYHFLVAEKMPKVAQKLSKACSERGLDMGTPTVTLSALYEQSIKGSAAPVEAPPKEKKSKKSKKAKTSSEEPSVPSTTTTEVVSTVEPTTGEEATPVESIATSTVTVTEDGKTVEETVEIVDTLAEGAVQRTTLKRKQTQESHAGAPKRFQRVDASQVTFDREELRDNTFLSKGGADGSYGMKAHNDLIKVRGKDFRAEKTKKKRATYRGGKIDMGSHSIKFD